MLADLLKKREELANLLGYKHWADMNSADKMAENSQNILKFIGELTPPPRPRPNANTKCCWRARKSKTRRCNRSASRTVAIILSNFVAASSISLAGRAEPYFPYDRVSELRILEVASKLFHVTFKPVPDAPV